MNTREIPNSILNFIGEIQQIHFPAQGHTSVVVSLTTMSGNFILKKTTEPLYSAWLKQEFEILTQLENRLLPIPKAYLLVEEEKHCWLLMSQFHGIRMREFLLREHDVAKRKKVISHFGEILREIHSTLCPEPLITTRESWLMSKLEEAEYNLRNYKVDGTKELLHKLKSSTPKEIPNTLIHGDFTIDNVMVNDNKIVGVIDWGGAAFGDPRYDLALAIRPKQNAFKEETDKQWFFEAYGLRSISYEEFEYFENGLYQFF
ncbi:phosphotransferase family protein [Paenibacillus sp. IITD108]|uniref:phosphotransferase family protein n=1 Tax=Paenibacillus sp. IITD108 TaxID=3116649 RepID=UPI002F421C35